MGVSAFLLFFFFAFFENHYVMGVFAFVVDGCLCFFVAFFL